MEKQHNTNNNQVVLSPRVHVCPETWASFQQLSPTAWHLLSTCPDVAAIELIVHPTPSFSISSAVLIGSPTAWLFEEGGLVSAEDTLGPETLSEHLWRIGREAGFCGIGPWLNEKTFTQELYSILLFPSMICVRDAQQLETLAEKTWTNTHTNPQNLVADCFTTTLDHNILNRIRAQQNHIKQIYSTDLGIPIHCDAIKHTNA